MGEAGGGGGGGVSRWVLICLSVCFSFVPIN